MTASSLFFREGCLRKDDPRVRKVPLFFGRPNLTELTRVYTELVTVTVGTRDETTSMSTSSVEVPPSEPKNPPKTPETTDAPSPAENATEALHRFWRAVTADDAATVAAEVAAAPQNAFLW